MLTGGVHLASAHLADGLQAAQAMQLQGGKSAGQHSAWHLAAQCRIPQLVTNSPDSLT